MEIEARNAVDQVARESYSRLVAFLAARSRDVAAAEDALADAFQAALQAWPHSGIPDKPEAWLLVTARRQLIDAARHARVQNDSLPTLLAVADEVQEFSAAGAAFPDERLKLLFVCAHPAIDVTARTALMLQIVLGLDAARMASAFVLKPSAMGQRLSRAKRKIRDAGIAFEVPAASELPCRLDSVLEAIYAAYTTGWDDLGGADARRKGLSAEAIALGHLLLQLLPVEPEVQGLLALMLYCEARRESRLSADGDFVPLSEQDTRRWSRPLLAQAHQLLWSAAQANRIGHFQLEAAIQCEHTRRAVTGRTDREEIALLYEGLVRLAPTTGAFVGRAAAIAEARGAATGWAALEAIPTESIRTYQPYWALRASLLRDLGREGEAQAAYELAIGLCDNEAMRAFLVRNALAIEAAR